jgi:hypothetical protein
LTSWRWKALAELAKNFSKLIVAYESGLFHSTLEAPEWQSTTQKASIQFAIYRGVVARERRDRGHFRLCV